MRRLIGPMVLLSLAALLAACADGSGFPSYPTMEEALGEVLDRPTSILYAEPFDRRRSLVIFQAGDHGPSVTLLEQAGRGWRMTGAVGLGGPLPRLGALSYDRANLGRVEEKIGTITHVKAETHLVFGEVHDPAITWVELTLDEEGARAARARMEGRFWAVQVPPVNQLTGFQLTAGDDRGVRFTASVGRGRGYRDRNLATAPLVAYRDEQQGIRLEHPVVAWVPSVKDGRLTIQLDASMALTVERRPDLAGRDLEELLREAAGEAGDRALDQGIRTLGAHPAAYLLEAVPDEAGLGSTYRARYLTVAGDSGYEVVCAAIRVYERDFWEREKRPLCDRVLETVRLGDVQG